MYLDIDVLILYTINSISKIQMSIPIFDTIYILYHNSVSSHRKLSRFYNTSRGAFIPSLQDSTPLFRCTCGRARWDTWRLRTPSSWTWYTPTAVYSDFRWPWVTLTFSRTEVFHCSPGAPSGSWRRPTSSPGSVSIIQVSGLCIYRAGEKMRMFENPRVLQYYFRLRTYIFLPIRFI